MTRKKNRLMFFYEIVRHRLQNNVTEYTSTLVSPSLRNKHTDIITRKASAAIVSCGFLKLAPHSLSFVSTGHYFDHSWNMSMPFGTHLLHVTYLVFKKLNGKL